MCSENLVGKEFEDLLDKLSEILGVQEKGRNMFIDVYSKDMDREFKNMLSEFFEISNLKENER